MISFLKKDLFFDRFLKFATKCPLSSKFSNVSLLDLPIYQAYFLHIIFRIFTLKYYKASHIAIYNDAKYKYDARKPGIADWRGGQRGP